MITIEDKKSCSGCTACVSVCPSKCISMIEDNEGFLYPQVAIDLCINCGKCEKNCPFRNKPAVDQPIKAFAVQNKSEDIRKVSTSGGAVSGIAEFVLSKGGVIFGAELNHNNKVVHSSANTRKGIKKFQGSKYVQSELGSTFTEIKELLIKDVYVLFCGLPCQVAGLKAFLSKEYNNLITIDLACHGVPSPKLFKMYIDFLEKKQRSKVKNVSFRDKSYGYCVSNIKVFFENGISRDCKDDVKSFTRTMFKGLSIRPSCHECAFKTLGRVSDFTLFDCTMIGNYSKVLDDNRGTTNILVQSKKGVEIINDACVQNCFRSIEVNINDVIRDEGTMLLKSAESNPKREAFFLDMGILQYETLVKKYAPISLKTKIGNLIKPIITKISFLNKFITKLNKKRSIAEYQKKYGDFEIGK